MTATISVPNKLYRRAQNTAKHLNMDYEQFFVVAIERYVSEHTAQTFSDKEPNDETVEAMLEGDKIIASGQRRFSDKSDFFESLGI